MAKVPDALNDRAKAGVVAGRLTALQTERFNLEVEAAIAGADLSDPAPTLGPLTVEGQAKTYEGRLKEIDGAQERLLAANSELRGDVEKILGERVE